MPANPFCELADDGIPLFELKVGLVLYLEAPPPRNVVADVYGYYIGCSGNRITRYRPTTSGEMPRPWDATARASFETAELPNLYVKRNWGYVFSDALNIDSWLFMFHGYRPRSEPGKASFFRFDFDWQVDAGFLGAFAEGLIERTPFLSGFCGYYLQPRNKLRYLSQSFDRIFSIAQRYWGIEAHNLDITVDYMLQGYKCVNWLTFIGERFRSAEPQAVSAAEAAGSRSVRTAHGTLIEAQPLRAFGDRHLQEALPGYQAVAQALEPLQIQEHAAFGGNRWTDDNTIDYIKRWTSGTP